MLVSTSGITLTGDAVEGVCALTDELLVVASDALEVAADAAPLPRPRPMVLQRCLARLLAAAVGSQIWLDDLKAGLSGKRLAKQARKIRCDGVAASLLAQQQRQVARADAAADASQVEGLPARLAKIDKAEAAALDAPRQEVYTNFPEIAPEPPAAEEPPPAAVPVAAEPQSKWPRWVTRVVGPGARAFLKATEEARRQEMLEHLLETDTSEDEARKLVGNKIDWSTTGSERELFLLDMIQQLQDDAAELAIKNQLASLKQDQLHREELHVVEPDIGVEVLRLEQLEVEYESVCAANPRPVWVCVCERALEDECELCQDGLHEKEV